jgi:hypothetical protein
VARGAVPDVRVRALGRAVAGALVGVHDMAAVELAAVSVLVVVRWHTARFERHETKPASAASASPYLASAAPVSRAPKCTSPSRFSASQRTSVATRTTSAASAGSAPPLSACAAL